MHSRKSNIRGYKYFRRGTNISEGVNIFLKYLDQGDGGSNIGRDKILCILWFCDNRSSRAKSSTNRILGATLEVYSINSHDYIGLGLVWSGIAVGVMGGPALTSQRRGMHPSISLPSSPSPSPEEIRCSILPLSIHLPIATYLPIFLTQNTSTHDTHFYFIVKDNFVVGWNINTK